MIFILSLIQSSLLVDTESNGFSFLYLTIFRYQKFQDPSLFIIILTLSQSVKRHSFPNKKMVELAKQSAIKLSAITCHACGPI